MDNSAPSYTTTISLMPVPKNLVMKLAKILKVVERIPKSGTNEQFGYKFVTESDVADEIRKQLGEEGVYLHTTIVSVSTILGRTVYDKPTFVSVVDLQFTFMDGTSGESLVSMWRGEAMDVGDKALYKAFTGCKKYFLMNAFLMSSGEDPENAGAGDGKEESPKPTTQRPPSRPPVRPSGPVTMLPSSRPAPPISVPPAVPPQQSIPPPADGTSEVPGPAPKSATTKTADPRDTAESRRLLAQRLDEVARRVEARYVGRKIFEDHMNLSYLTDQRTLSIMGWREMKPRDEFSIDEIMKCGKYLMEESKKEKPTEPATASDYVGGTTQ